MKPSLLTTILVTLCFCFTAYGQEPALKQTIRFNSGKFTPSPNHRIQLNQLIDSLKNLPSAIIELQGHADNTGNYNNNRLLSEKRAIAVKNMLVNAGIEQSSITIKAFGPDNPIATNKTITGRKLNRRVEIIVSSYIPEPKETPAIVENIRELYNQLGPPPQRFCINPKKDTSIRCAQGTVIYIKANSILPVSDCNNACISFQVKEVFTKADMILNNLSTTSNGAIIETQGMILTEAFDCKGNSLQLAKGKDIIIMVPTDSINPSAVIFKGDRGQDSIMNWIVDDNAPLSNFSLPELDICAGWICGKGKKEINCKPCKFFFCRIGRIPKVIHGAFSANQRGRNRAFRQCQEDLEKLNDTTVKIISEDPLTIETRPPLERRLLPGCQQIEDMFKRYGVNNMEELILAINKPLLEKYKVSTVEQLRDTLMKIATENIELFVSDKSTAFNDLKYYVYANSRLGWSNVDIFMKFLNTPLITVNLNVKPEPNIDCKLVFKESNIVIPATIMDGKFQFINVPQGANGWIVAIKYENGNPFLAMKEIIIANKSFDVEFKQTTNQQLKAQLKLLDQKVSVEPAK
ncbi:MAG: OmpA family protein [Chitinophagaceae bacterium]